MSKPSKRQKGAVRHAEGQHGDKTHAAFLEQLTSRNEAEAAIPEQTLPREGRSRLQEDREQHDEADKNAEKNRAKRSNARDELGNGY